MSRRGPDLDLVPPEVNGVPVGEGEVGLGPAGGGDARADGGDQLLQEAGAGDVVSVHVGVHWKLKGRNSRFIR